VLASAKLQRVLMLVLVGLVVAIVAILMTNRSSPSSFKPASSQFAGPTMPPGLHAANFSLIDQNHRRVTLARDRGKVVVLTFIHSLCHVPAIGVSVDPSQDTVANRRAFLAKHELTGRMAFVNGSLRTMRRVWHDYAIQPVTPKIDHSTFVLLIDKRGLERVGFAADQLTPEGLAHDIRVLQREPS
jgi:protein SCO1